MRSFPVTPRDFEAIECLIGINADEFCPICDGKLVKISDKRYKCRHCRKEFTKTYQLDPLTKEKCFILKPKGAP